MSKQEIDPVKNPYEVALMVMDTEHELYSALSTGDKVMIRHWARLLHDLCATILQKV